MGSCRQRNEEFLLQQIDYQAKVVELDAYTMMVPFLRLFTALLVLNGLVSCAQLGNQSITGDSAPAGNEVSNKEISLIQQQLEPRLLPDDPKYVRVRQACFFCVTHPEDGSMVPVGMLNADAYIILREVDGEWMEVQLTSGQFGSVLGTNIREITPEEDTSKEYLEPQPDLAPLSLPQVDASPHETTLLGS